MRHTSYDVNFDVQRTDRQRTILRVLRSKSTATLQELVDVVVSHEEEASASTSLRDRVEISLYHVDVPKLADAGLVTFEPKTRMVHDARPISPAVR